MKNAITALPYTADLPGYLEQSKKLYEEVSKADRKTIHWLSEHAHYLNRLISEITTENFSMDDAQTVIARYYHFESWSNLSEFVDDITNTDSITVKFEQAVEAGFMWACEYGYNDVIEYLLEKGADMHSTEETGLSGLHWAILGRNTGTIKLLLQKGASLELQNIFGGTALGCAFWAVVNYPELDYVPVLQLLLEAGAVIEPGTLAWLEQQEVLSSSTKQNIRAVLERYGAT